MELKIKHFNIIGVRQFSGEGGWGEGGGHKKQYIGGIA